MQGIELLRRILKHYSVDLALAVVFMLVAFVYVYDQPTLLSAIARKVALASAGLGLLLHHESAQSGFH
jgi:hypothetical protein